MSFNLIEMCLLFRGFLIERSSVANREDFELFEC